MIPVMNGIIRETVDKFLDKYKEDSMIAAFEERALDKTAFERMYRLTGMRKGQKSLSLSIDDAGLCISDKRLYSYIPGSRLRTISIKKTGVMVEMKCVHSPEDKDPEGHILSNRENRCSIAYYGPDKAMKAFKEIDGQDIVSFIQKLEALIGRIVVEAPEKEKRTRQERLDALMDSI